MPKHFTEQARHNMSVAHKGLPGYWKGKRRYDCPMLGRHHSKETRERMSAIAKGKIKSSEHKTKLSTALKGRHCSPANGDFSLGITLAGLIPDFTNTNGKKEIIEIFGDYWHSPEVVGDDWRRTELGKIMLYNSLNYKCLILWGSELQNLTDNEIVNKINAFFRRKGGKF